MGLKAGCTGSSAGLVAPHAAAPVRHHRLPAWRPRGSPRDFFTGYGIDISRVMTDNGPAYRSRLFNDVLAAQQVKHVFTRPYRPQTNGKVERFNRTLVAEWAYGRYLRRRSRPCAAVSGVVASLQSPPTP
ncbi:transposase [Corynebacterium xerosis]|nr:transposase [Corynebacterium xerosis]